VWCTRQVPVTRILSAQGRLDVTLDGVTFFRTRKYAERAGTSLVHHVEWDRIEGAEVTRTRKGRSVVRLQVADAPRIEDHKHDPNALKVPTAARDDAHQLVDQINHEAETRRRWAHSHDAQPHPQTDRG
jgi:hypothetical protein